MMGDGFYVQKESSPTKKPPNSNTNNSTKNSKKKKKRGGGGAKKRTMTFDQTLAYKSISEWVFLDSQSDPSPSSIDIDDGFLVKLNNPPKFSEKLVFELHCHTICSDGFLSPSKLVEKAHHNGVKVLALTDHDTMAGIPQALEAAHKYGIKIIPGVEISTIFYPRTESGSEEPVHILAYYSSCGPAKFHQLDKFLFDIREGRYHRAKNMILKLNKLKLPIKWESVAKIAGDGVAPGRVHVARAMVEAGHVENLKQAFARYLFDGGPAYATGSEPDVEETVQMIRETGGVSVLAHPWALKNPIAVIKRLKEAGLNGIEVYRSDGKLAAYSELADTYDLLKLGGSDFHGRGGNSESALGSVSLPVVAVHEFLKLARPIWCSAILEILENYVNDPSDSNLDLILGFGKPKVLKSISSITHSGEVISQCLSRWLTDEERQSTAFEAIKSKLLNISVNQRDLEDPTRSR